jgi:hypothetical protein
MNVVRSVRARGGSVALMVGEDEDGAMFEQAIAMPPSIADVLMNVVAAVQHENGEACVAFTAGGCDRFLGKGVRICSSCGARKPMNRCNGCKLLCYCDESCQRRDWAQHAAYCREISKIHTRTLNATGMDARQSFDRLVEMVRAEQRRTSEASGTSDAEV